MKRRVKYERKGAPAAIRAESWGLELELEEISSEAFRTEGDVAIVDIVGPLTHHAEWFCDNYDAIGERVRAAFESSASSVMLCLDCPGGDASGAFELARGIRAMADEAKKPIVAYVDGVACSSGYALACACDQIVAPPSAYTGSIGVIAMMLDATAMDRSIGLKFLAVTSGARKADNNPHVALSEGAVAATQADVDSFAQLFFAWVAERRPMSVEQIAALEAGVLRDGEALRAGLIDSTATKNELLASLASGNFGGKKPAAEAVMSWKDDMKKAAEGGDEEAKKALAALEDEEPKKDDEPAKKDDEPKKEEKKSETDEPAKKDDEPKEDDKKAAKASADAIAMLGEHDRVIARMVKEKEDTDRASILEKLELTENQKKALVAMPLAQMRLTVDVGNFKKKASASLAERAGVVSAVGAQGERQTANLDPTVSEKIDRRMGLGNDDQRVKWNGNERILPSSLSREGAKEILERNKQRTQGAVGGVK
jgi:signal peptide peptidase SppA